MRGFLLIPPDAEPGTLSSYSQPCTYTIAAVIQRLAGMPLTAYLRPRLLARLESRGGLAELAAET